MTEFKETELDERASRWRRSFRLTRLRRQLRPPRLPRSPWPPSPTRLYQHFIKHDPNDPNWEGRDRFILSGGHASLTQYVQLYFSGYGGDPGRP